MLRNVPVGRWHLKVDASDGEGLVQFTGETDVEVVGGQVTQVALQLVPTTGGILIVVTWGSVCVPAPFGLVSWWQGEGNAQDAAGGNNGALMNGTAFAEGRVGQAFSFDGVDDFVRMPNSPSLNPVESFSIDAWIYPMEHRHSAILSKWGDLDEWDEQRSYVFEMYADGSLNFAISDSAHQDDGAFHSFRSAPQVVQLNVWSHVAAVYNRNIGTRTLYLNGIKLVERTDEPITTFRSVADASIGVQLRSPQYFRAPSFLGMLDEVDFYARALTQQEIKRLYLSGSVGKCK